MVKGGCVWGGAGAGARKRGRGLHAAGFGCKGWGEACAPLLLCRSCRPVFRREAYTPPVHKKRADGPIEFVFVILTRTETERGRKESLKQQRRSEEKEITPARYRMRESLFLGIEGGGRGRRCEGAEGGRGGRKGLAAFRFPPLVFSPRPLPPPGCCNETKSSKIILFLLVNFSPFSWSFPISCKEKEGTTSQTTRRPCSLARLLAVHVLVTFSS